MPFIFYLHINFVARVNIVPNAPLTFSSLTWESSDCTDADLQRCYRQWQNNISFLTDSKIHKAEEYFITRQAWKPDSSKHWRLVEKTCSARFTDRRPISGSAGRFVCPLSEADTEQSLKPVIIYMQGTGIILGSGPCLLHLTRHQGTQSKCRDT